MQGLRSVSFSLSIRDFEVNGRIGDLESSRHSCHASSKKVQKNVIPESSVRFVPASFSINYLFLPW